MLTQGSERGQVKSFVWKHKVEASKPLVCGWYYLVSFVQLEVGQEWAYTCSEFSVYPKASHKPRQKWSCKDQCGG